MLKKGKQSEIARVFSFMKDRIILFSACMILDAILTSICFNIVLAFISKYAYNAAEQHDISLLYKALGIALTAFIIGSVFQPIFQFTAKKCVRKTMTEIRTKLFRHLEELSISSFEDSHSGEMISRLTNDLSSVENVYYNQLNPLVFALVHGVIAITALFIVDYRIALVVLVLGLLTVAINVLFAKRLRKISDLIQQKLGEVTQRLVDLIQSIPVTKMFQIEEEIFDDFRENNDNTYKLTKKRILTNTQLNALNFMFSNLKGLGVMSFGLYLLLNGQISLGAILAVIFLQGNASFLFENIGRFISDVQKSLAGAIRVFEILDMSTENDNKANLFDNSSLSNIYKNEMIKLENAEFSYKENKVLDNVSLSIPKGSVTALVGPSGGGKSTIIKLIMGFYQLDNGKLIVSEKPVNNYTLEQLRSQIAYVPQNAYLFYGTILENISYGKNNASQEEIIEAAKAANAHDFIMQMPNGYETLVGERGESLSGGQRQRIAIARAILKDSPILLLDEATSALDSESEQLVQDALNKLMKGRTTLVIAHRLTTVTHADKIYVLENGKVVESGTNEELLTKDGLYSKLYKMQFINDANGSEQI